MYPNGIKEFLFMPSVSEKLVVLGVNSLYNKSEALV